MVDLAMSFVPWWESNDVATVAISHFLQPQHATAVFIKRGFLRIKQNIAFAHEALKISKYAVYHDSKSSIAPTSSGTPGSICLLPGYINQIRDATIVRTGRSWRLCRHARRNSGHRRLYCHT